MTDILIKTFFIAFFVNLLYEILHSVLYKTCLSASLKKYVFLILKAAAFDGFVISAMYFAVYLIFQNQNIFFNFYQLFVFLLISLVFAYGWEIYSLKKGKWEYSPRMPLIFGAGVTPLVQLPIAGLLSVYFAIYFLI